MSFAELLHILTLQDYNTRIVVFGAACLGAASGMIGTFLLLRKRALLGDALSHATLPGIALAFIVMAASGATGKSLPGLLVGATISGLIGVSLILLIHGWTRLKEDAALGIVLSVFFGVGIGLLGIVQQMTSGSAAGLESFIYGKTASMLRSDAILMAGSAALVAVLCAALFKELALLCFDPGYARSQGWPTMALDLSLMALVTLVTVIGLQAVGLILVLAMLVIPPAAARFWTQRLSRMFIIAAVLGAISGMLGAVLSAMFQRLPAGAVIVLTATTAFVISLLLGTERGVLATAMRRRALDRTVGRQHLLRTAWELAEGREDQPIAIDALVQRRSWSAAQLEREIGRAEGEGLLRRVDGSIRLTARGLTEAGRLVRNHRLWELYLIRYADVAASHVDRDADAIEHVLGHDLVAELEAALPHEPPLPASPHEIPATEGR